MTALAARPVVVLDANVLVGALRRNVLLSLAEAGLFRPRWSRAILEETERTLARLTDDPDLAERQRRRMAEAFPEALVTGFERLVAELTLPDPDDRPMLAVAIETGAGVIVSDNLRDFPAERLAPHGVAAVALDAFLIERLEVAGPEAIAALRTMRARFRRPALDAATLIGKTERDGLVRTAALLRPRVSML